MKRARSKASHAVTSAPAVADDRQNESAMMKRVRHDPRFAHMKRANKTVRLDDRFREALRKKILKPRSAQNAVDKFGRPRRNAAVSTGKQERMLLKDMYQDVEISSSSESESDSAVKVPPVNPVRKSIREDGAAKERLKHALPDESGSEKSGGENDEDSDFSLSEDEDHVDSWAVQNTQNIPLGEETRRIALVNMDWERISAVDLLSCLSSFLTRGGEISRVTVYPSEFGMERMAQEAISGPRLDVPKHDPRKSGKKNSSEAAEKLGSTSEKRDSENESASDEISRSSIDASESESDGTDDEEDARAISKAKQNELIRKYELDKMRYYFAVVEFDSAESANAVYKECDGLEFGSSGNLFDMRFIPDDMHDFEQRPPRDVATSVPENYEPPQFSTTALLHSKVELSWDKEDARRTVILKKRNFQAQELLEDDFKAYLASSASETDSETGRANAEEKRKILLSALSRPSIPSDAETGEDHESAVEGDMEATFHTGLEEAAKDLLEREAKRDGLRNESAWEARLRRAQERKADRRRERKETLKNLGRAGLEGQEGSDGESLNDAEPGQGSDPEEDLGFDDPFFTNPTAHERKALSALDKKSRSVQDEQKAQADAKSRAELELLLMSEMENDAHQTALGTLEDSDEERRDRKRLRMSKKKYEKYKREQKQAAKASTAVQGANNLQAFEPDLTDTRFASLFSAPDYSVDPTHPKFKSSALNARILHEKVHRGLPHENDSGSNVPSGADARRAPGAASMHPSSSAAAGAAAGKAEEADWKALADKVKRQQTDRRMKRDRGSGPKHKKGTL
ncbi:Pre-rRNA-processing protein esf1 [Porphyridium purpureum]|uniref:Pre-rRNA-processing protein esf1 n=1 Tax=Porphyridium purpureum TaxID=35688 RepID=A0A5J4Z2Z5_PORPP|nr:Pre-rRNA-processing protein esf1 [Porphyridium purpureum]|eukprot:POR0617..scf295_1